MNAATQTEQHLLPLVLDVDGTLPRVDMLQGFAIAFLKTVPWAVFGLISSFLQGKAALKRRLAEHTALYIANLHIDQDLAACARAGE